MSRLFPVDTTGFARLRETYVVWDMEGYSIPESLDPCSIVQQIKAAIKKEGFGGPVTGTVYCSLIELEDQFWEGKFHVHPIEVGHKRSRLNMIIGELVFWALDAVPPVNLLVLSENKENVEQDPRFSIFRQASESKGIFVAVAQPETLINQETAFEQPKTLINQETASEESGNSACLC